MSPSWLAFPLAEGESRAVKLSERIVTAPTFRLVFLTITIALCAKLQKGDSSQDPSQILNPSARAFIGSAWKCSWQCSPLPPKNK